MLRLCIWDLASAARIRGVFLSFETDRGTEPKLNGLDPKRFETPHRRWTPQLTTRTLKLETSQESSDRAQLKSAGLYVTLRLRTKVQGLGLGLKFRVWELCSTQRLLRLMSSEGRRSPFAQTLGFPSHDGPDPHFLILDYVESMPRAKLQLPGPLSPQLARKSMEVGT